MTDAPLFSPDEWLRYTRHIQLPKFGVEGQTKLKQAHVLVVGSGGLGAPVLMYLAAAGVGKITVFDGDKVEITNLQRQVIFDSNDIGQSKAICAVQRLNELNPEIEIRAVAEFFSLENSRAAVADADIVLDCTDNFATRYLINDRCAELQTPWIFASIYQFSGQCALFVPGETCFRCLFPEAPKEVLDCNQAGVIGVLPGILGTIQATEAIKFLAGLPTPLKNHLLIFDAMDYSSRTIELAQNANCVVCVKKQGPAELKEFYTQHCTSDSSTELQLSTEEVRAGIDDYYLVDVRSQTERKAFNIGGMHLPMDGPDTQWDDLPPRKILCYCQTGVRSTKVAEKLKAKGHTVYSLQGGLANWLTSN